MSEWSPSWFDRWRLTVAARKYARQLPRLLAKGWGASESYSAGQVRAALRLARLEGNYEILAFAAFLSAQDFDALRQDFGTRLTREAARAYVVSAMVSNNNSPYAQVAVIDQTVDGQML